MTSPPSLRSTPLLWSRRELLRRSMGGFGLVGLAAALDSKRSWAAAAESVARGAPPAPKLLEAAPGAALTRLHHAPRARRVIVLFMNGGPSHVDTFDPKPALKTHAGEKPSGKVEKSPEGGFLPSPFVFAPRGKSGVVLSELFPRLSELADDLCIVRSMRTDVPNHEPGLLLMHSGHQQPVRPSMGSWVSYGLGTENQNLPAFVVLAPRHPVVGPQLWSSSFLPGAHQGMAVNTSDMSVQRLVPDLGAPDLDRSRQRKMIDALQALNHAHLAARGADAALEAQIESMETAFRMQAEASEAFDIAREPAVVRERYGASNFGASCLLARRLSERGVRFVEVCYLSRGNNQPWDTHQENDDRHRELCADSDRATAALLLDLKERGLLEETLVVWGGEFGRTPYAQPSKDKKPGRDHHHTGFSMLLAGGGVKRGHTHGATDELGMHAAESPVHVHDLHATALHLLGIDHERLVYRYSGRDFRLTDVHGQVVRELLA